MTKAQIETLLAKYYEALERVADGKSATLATENGTRTYTEHDIDALQRQITILERRLSTPSGRTHNAAVANMNRAS
jgi:hypothetical protein